MEQRSGSIQQLSEIGGGLALAEATVAADNAPMPHFELWRFRFRDPVSGRWIRARYRATLADLDRRYGEGGYQTFGPPEVRDVGADAGYSYFNPLRPDPARLDAGNVAGLVTIARPLHCRRVAIAGIAH